LNTLQFNTEIKENEFVYIFLILLRKFVNLLDGLILFLWFVICQFFKFFLCIWILTLNLTDYFLQIEATGCFSNGSCLWKIGFIQASRLKQCFVLGILMKLWLLFIDLLAFIFIVIRFFIINLNYLWLFCAWVQQILLIIFLRWIFTLNKLIWSITIHLRLQHWWFLFLIFLL